MKKNIFLIVCFVLAGMFCLTASGRSQMFFFENPLVNKPAPDFVLESLDGGATAFQSYRDGRNTIVFFWATWCPHCRVQLRELSAAKEDLERKNIKVLLIDIGESRQQVQPYIETNGVPFTVLLDQDGDVAQQYGLLGVPTYVFVNKDGFVKHVDHSVPESYEKFFSE